MNDDKELTVLFYEGEAYVSLEELIDTFINKGYYDISKAFLGVLRRARKLRG